MPDTTFQERVSRLPSKDYVALARVYGPDNKLLSIIPNIPGKANSLKIFSGFSWRAEADAVLSGREIREALEIFGPELIAEAEKGKHPNIQVLTYARDGDYPLRLEFVRTSEANVLEAITKGEATPEQKFAALQLLDQGKIRTAEKTYGPQGTEPLWEPQGYAIDALNAAFGLLPLGAYQGIPGSFDKILLKQQKANLEQGVGSPFMPPEELAQLGVRFIPGSFARYGAFIGSGTTLMPGSIVNIGAYVAGEGVMVDGGARVASGAQVGRGVKIGAGTGLEGVLEPKGMMPTIVEDRVRIGANCEVTGIVEEGALIASGVVMAGGKKIYDERTHDFHPPLVVQTAEGLRPVPHIPRDRIAVPGVYMPPGSPVGKEVVLLLEKPASESSFMDIPRNIQLYVRN